MPCAQLLALREEMADRLQKAEDEKEEAVAEVEAQREAETQAKLAVQEAAQREMDTAKAQSQVLGNELATVEEREWKQQIQLELDAKEKRARDDAEATFEAARSVYGRTKALQEAEVFQTAVFQESQYFQL